MENRYQLVINILRDPDISSKNDLKNKLIITLGEFSIWRSWTSYADAYALMDDPYNTRLKHEVVNNSEIWDEIIPIVEYINKAVIE